jgi:hypothetical protein
MQTIFCQEETVIDGKKRQCNRWLGQLSDLQIDILKLDPEGKSQFRCPACKPEVRWKEIRFENGELIFSSSDKKPEHGITLNFDKTDVTEVCA